MEKDQTLRGNESIEKSIIKFKKSMTDENLTHTLSLLRKRMKEKGHFVVAVKMAASGNMELRTVKTQDGKEWFAVFTSFEEQNNGGDNIKSTFTAEMEQVFQICFQSPNVEGILLNPWNLSLKMDKTIISIIMGV
ncbi:MAG: SseB family protein [Eubacteriales bacterium]|nr:SseB family protein [Eubacteriales bacterium]